MSSSGELDFIITYVTPKNRAIESEKVTRNELSFLCRSSDICERLKLELLLLDTEMTQTVISCG